MEYKELIIELDLLIEDLQNFLQKAADMRRQLMHVDASTAPNGGDEQMNEEQVRIYEAIKKRKAFLNK